MSSVRRTVVGLLPVGAFLAAVCFLHGASSLSAAEAPPPAPKVSTFAPAKDLERQVEQYIKGLDNIVGDEEEYKDGKDKIVKDANTLVVLALALGLHDEENKFKANAPALMKAAGELAAAADLAAAKKSVAALHDAVDGKLKAEAELKWIPVASLPELMKQVPLINTKLKRNVKPAKFKSKAKDTAGYSAAIAAIAQGTIADVSDVKKPQQINEWYKLMALMRDHAAAVNAAIHKGDEPAAAAEMKKLQQSCEDCHAVFHPEAAEKMDKEE